MRVYSEPGYTTLTHAIIHFFQGYTWFTCFVVLQVSLGGMLVALVMKCAVT